jgi:hypothetical protein
MHEVCREHLCDSDLLPQASCSYRFDLAHVPAITASQRAYKSSLLQFLVAECTLGHDLYVAA